MKHKKKLKFDNRLLAIPLVFVALGAIFIAGMKVGKSAGEPVPTPTVATSPSPTIEPTPTQTPVPTITTSATNTTNTTNATGTGCAQFKPENGPVYVKVVLEPKSGTMVGKTVVRVIPSGTCPGESAAVEQWLNEGDRTWTSPGLHPGRYRVEVANGNYQGVVSEYLNLTEAGYYGYTIQTD